MAEAIVGAGLRSDPDVLVGYASARAEAGDLRLGSRARLRSGTVLYHGSRIGSDFETGHHVVVREDCVIGSRVSVWSNSVIDYGCQIADDVKIHSNCYVAQYTEIEEGAFLAPGVTIANDLYPGQASSAKHMSGPQIGARAQIGVNVTILPFVRIGAGALVGAGAVVVMDIPEDAVAFGNPATVHGCVRDLTPIQKRVAEVATSVSRFRRVERGGPQLIGTPGR